MKKKVLTVLLTLMMMLTFIPTIAFGEEATSTDEAGITEINDNDAEEAVDIVDSINTNDEVGSTAESESISGEANSGVENDDDADVAAEKRISIQSTNGHTQAEAVAWATAKSEALWTMTECTGHNA